MPLDWDKYARDLGYEAEGPMLRDLYTDQELSITDIAMKLGVGKITLRNRLILYGIAMRSPGGANNSGKFAYKLHLMDQRLLWSVNDISIAAMLGCSSSLVYKYKRRQRGNTIESARHAVLRDQSDSGAEPVFDVIQEPPGPGSKEGA